MKTSPRPLPREFLRWQVRLRAHTMAERNGAPHVGVAPLLTVKRPGFPLAVTTHSIVCGLLPREDRLAEKTADFRELHRRHAAAGARELYDRGLDYLRGYYQSEGDFDPTSVTTLVGHRAGNSPLVTALLAEPRCQLLFYVFALDDRSEVGRSRCWQLDCEAEIHRDGPIFDNVWWHNALFHGEVADAVVLRFVHRQTYDTQFGRLEAVA